MDRVLSGFVAVVGAYVLVRFWRAPDSSRAARRIFGRNIKEGSREHRFALVWDRVFMTVCAGALCVLGILGTLGVITLPT